MSNAKISEYADARYRIADVVTLETGEETKMKNLLGAFTATEIEVFGAELVRGITRHKKI